MEGVEHDGSAVGSASAKVASLVVFGRFAVLFISGITFVIVARFLGPGVYGIYILAMSYTGLFTGVADIGVCTALNKFIAQYRASGSKEDLNKVVSNGYFSVILSALAFSLIAFSLSSFVAVHVLGSASYTYIVQVVSFCILGGMLFGVSYNMMVGFGKGSYVALMLILQSVVQSIISIILVMLGLGAIAPILGLLVGYLTSIVTVFVLLTTKLKIRLRKPSFAYIKKFFGFSSPIAVYNGLRGVVTNIAPIILGIFATTVIVGNFGVAVKTSSIISTFTDALGLVVLPMFAYTVSAKSIGKNIGKFYNYAVYMTFMLVAPALFYLAVLSKEFSFTVFSSKYLLAPTYISLISIGTLLWILATYTTMLLISTSKVKKILKYSLIMTCIELTLIFTVVPMFGAIGLISILFLVTPSLITFLMSKAARDLLDVHLDLRKLARVVIAGLISAAFLLPLLIVPGEYIAVLVVGVIEQMAVYPVILALTGAAGREELKVLRDVTGNIPVMSRIISIFADYTGHFVRA
ncbi:MAG: oligosaccharide flippase family protein [Candidatus Micrarchaeaceae archaeon]|jgi:O-antigen/teichoic acid export membrane protein